LGLSADFGSLIALFLTRDKKLADFFESIVAKLNFNSRINQKRRFKMPTGKIMIVDDEQDVREAIKLQLTGKKFTILEAENGEEAIKTLKQADHLIHVGLILCDIRMPKVDGVECIDYIKKNAPGIPIVVITAFPDAELAASLMKKGIKEYLVKPVSKEKLSAVVDKLIDAGKDVEL